MQHSWWWTGLQFTIQFCRIGPNQYPKSRPSLWKFVLASSSTVIWWILKFLWKTFPKTQKNLTKYSQMHEILWFAHRIHYFLTESSYFWFRMTYGHICRNIRGTTMRKLWQPVWPPSKISKNPVCLYVDIRAPKPAFVQVWPRTPSFTVWRSDHYVTRHFQPMHHTGVQAPSF